MNYRLLIGVLIGLCFAQIDGFAHESHSSPPHWQQATGWPDRVNATLSSQPSSGFSVTWRTDSSVGRTIAQIAKATPDARFDIVAETVRAETEQVDLETMITEEGTRSSLENVGLGATHYHSVTFSGLEADTLYAWRVQGARGCWSEWFQTRTAAESGPVSFVYFGDAQNGVRPNWSRVIRMANQTQPDADFFLHAGDLVQKGDSDYNWAEWFVAGGFIHAQTPIVPVPGNHENMSVWPNGPDGPRERVRTPLWRPQFTLPIEKSLPSSLHESVYQIRYCADLHLFVVDSARDSFVEQTQWLKSELEKSDARWKIVSMHHPYFAPAEFDSKKTDRIRRKAFKSVIDDSDVDLVLAGHIHTYGRFSENAAGKSEVVRSMDGDARDVKRVYMISSSGAKVTKTFSHEEMEALSQGTKADFGQLAVDRLAGNTPMFQVIRVDGNTLAFEAYMATGESYDSFVLEKNSDGRKTLVEGEEAHGELRSFENTGPYREWWDLR